METIQRNTVFTNVAKTSDGGVFWEVNMYKYIKLVLHASCSVTNYARAGFSSALTGTK